MNSIRNPTRQGLALSLLLLVIPFAWPLAMYMWLRYATGHRGGAAAGQDAGRRPAPSAQLGVRGSAGPAPAVGGFESPSTSAFSLSAGKVVTLVVVVFVAGAGLAAFALAPGRRSEAATAPSVVPAAPSLAPAATGAAATPVPVTAPRGDVPYGIYYADALTAAQRQWCRGQPYLVADALEEFHLIGFDQWDGETWNGDTAAFEQTGNYTSGCSVAWYRHENASTSLAAPVFPFGTMPYRLTLPEDWIGATNAGDWAIAVDAFNDTRVLQGGIPEDSPLRSWPQSAPSDSFVAFRVQPLQHYDFGALLVFGEPMAGRTSDEALDWWETNGATRFYGGATPGPDDSLSVKRVDLPVGPAIILSGRSDDLGTQPTFRTMYVIPVGETEYVVTFQLSSSSDMEPADMLRVVESFRMRAG